MLPAFCAHESYVLQATAHSVTDVILYLEAVLPASVQEYKSVTTPFDVSPMNPFVGLFHGDTVQSRPVTYVLYECVGDCVGEIVGRALVKNLYG